jgi:hypothetical protein
MTRDALSAKAGEVMTSNEQLSDLYSWLLDTASEASPYESQMLTRAAAVVGEKLLSIANAALQPAVETPADALRVLAEVRRRVHEMKERHVPGLFTDEMARLGELMATVLGPESPVKTSDVQYVEK